MDESRGGPVEVGVGAVRILVGLTAPQILAIYRQHADLAEHFDEAEGHDAGYSFVGVSEDAEWPQLVVTQRFSPCRPGFAPGVLFVPEQRQLFIGAGTRLLSYESRAGRWRRSWTDETSVGFWGWQRHGDVVVMSAELELAAWTAHGRKLWAAFVEPPWTYRVAGCRVIVDVMGKVQTFDLKRGPGAS